MTRGLLQSSPVQQMMAGNSNWCSVYNIRPPTHHHHHHQQTSPFHLLPSPSTLFPHSIPSSSSSSSSSPSSSSPSSSSSSLPIPSWLENQDKFPESLSQLLAGGLVMDDEAKVHLHNFQPRTTLENWEEQVLHQASSASFVDVRQENCRSSYVYEHGNQDFQAAKPPPSWSHLSYLMPASSPRSCVAISSNMLDFSASKGDGRHPPPDLSPECNSGATGGAVKKARVQPSTTLSTFKQVRKEKLGDRITALHELVSPYGKTDTASVLLEAIGYIRFLQNQIEALSLPYLGSGSANMRQQQSVQGERNSIFWEDPGQMLNDNPIKRKGTPEQDFQGEPKKDLRSRGLCLVPVSSTLHVGNDNGAYYWAPALGGGFR